MTGLVAKDIPEIERAADAVEGSSPRVAAYLRDVVRRLRALSRRNLTTGEAAAILGVTPQTVRNWVDRGWLPSQRTSLVGRRRIPMDALEPALAIARSRRQVVRASLSDAHIDAALGEADGPEPEVDRPA